MLCPTRYICRRCNGKQQRRRGGRRVQLPDWVMNKIKKQHINALTWVTKMEPLTSGESLNVFQPTPLTTQHFSVKRCASAQNPRKVDEWVESVGVGHQVKKKYPGVNNKYQLCARKVINNFKCKKINNTHQQLHQVQTNKNYQPYHEM